MTADDTWRFEAHPLTDPIAPTSGAWAAPDDTPIFTAVLLNTLLDRLTAQDTVLAQITERLDRLVADFTTAAKDVADFIAAAEAKWDEATAQIADLKARLAAAPSTDPGVQEAADNIEAALADGKQHLALAAPAAGADTTAPAGATATPTAHDAAPVVAAPVAQAAQVPVPAAQVVPAEHAQPATPAPSAPVATPSPAPHAAPAGAVPDPAHPGAVVTAAPVAEAHPAPAPMAAPAPASETVKAAEPVTPEPPKPAA